MTEKMPWAYRIALIVIILGCVALLLFLGYGTYCLITGHSMPIETKTQGNPAPIPTFTEIQQMLVDVGYDIGTDGVDGRIGPNTLTGWEGAICDQEASKMFSQMAGNEK